VSDIAFKISAEKGSLDDTQASRLDRESAQRELAGLRSVNPPVSGAGLENNLLAERFDSPAREVVEDYREKVKIFNLKCRDSDIIRNLYSCEMLMTVSSLGNPDAGSTLRLWSVSGSFNSGQYAESNPPELLWEKHFEDGVTPLMPSPDESLVAVSTRGLVSLYATNRTAQRNPDDGKTVFDCAASFPLPSDCRATSLVFSRDGSYLEVSGSDGILRILSLNKGEGGADKVALREMARFYMNPEDRTVVNGHSIEAEPRKTIALRSAA
jgi:WD40 repeat protein